MTSATGQKKRSDRSSMTARSRRGFTLIEMLLSVGVLVLIASVSILSLGAFRDEQKLMSASMWYEVVLRHARAEAMRQGRTMRLSFDATTGKPSLMCESDPIGAPGRFDQLREPWAGSAPPSLSLVRCRRDGNAAFHTAGLTEDDDDEALQTLWFFADGTSDWAELEVRSETDPSAPVLIVTLNGFSGAVGSRMVTVSEYDAESATW